MDTDLVERIRAAETAAGPQEGPGLWEAYRTLGPDGAVALARSSLGLLEAADDTGRFQGVEILTRLACLMPEVLEDMHVRLLESPVFDYFTYPYGRHPSVLFNRAGNDACRALLALLRSNARPELSNALASLAWMWGDEVTEAFATWRAEPPPWAPDDFRTDDYTMWAGWTLSAGGLRHDLFPPGCCRLAPGYDPSSPVTVVQPLEEPCGACGGPLTAILDLDLTHERLSFLRVSGRRLRLVTCERCVCWTVVDATVDGEGGAAWSGIRREPPVAVEWSYLSARRLGLGPPRRPLEAMAFGDELSQLGGQPTWVQYHEYPPCPKCGEPMTFLAQVDEGEIDQLAEGVIYVFLDQACGTSASLLQAT